LPQYGYSKPRVATYRSSPCLCLTANHRYICSSLERCSWLRFTPLDAPCSVKMFNRTVSCKMWLFITHGQYWA
jgi:hypothetical protein